MDAINAGLWETLTADAALRAQLGNQPEGYSRGVWNRKADDGAPLPLVCFRKISPGFEYTFGGLSSVRLVYEVACYAEDAGERAGAEAAEVICEHVRRVLTDAEFAVAGYELLLCRPYAGLPPDDREGANGRTQYREGLLVEIIVTPE